MLAMTRVLQTALIALMCELSCVAAIAEQDRSILGNWRMESASIPFPEQCQTMSLRFEENGTYVGDDGSMVMTMTYRIEKQSNGLEIEFSYLSDNGRPNCQGLKPEFVRNHALKTALIRFTEDPDKVRMYFGPTEQQPYLVLARMK